MRRGHQGIGGWRNENPRHIRPRNGGNPHYRPSRGFNVSHPPRFPPPGPRPFRPNFHHQHDSEDHDHHERSRYRPDTSRYSYNRSKDNVHHNERQILPLLQMKRGSGTTSNSYKMSSHNSDRYHVNSMGDVDHRQTQSKSDYNIHPVPPWSVDNKFQSLDDRTYNRTYAHDSIDKTAQPNLVGHRPPASDHYDANPSSTIENSNTFTRSVDDTVNIVRKRLLSRDAQEPPLRCEPDDDSREVSNNTEPSSSHIDEPSKKKIPRQRQNIRVNCDKIKNKIVHQLFKMDKKKMHKLLDNPNSSTKFEYAINSLLTESQNSFNQHLRSVAEKSLCTSSREFIHDDNNTIYEDTFMRQMQCILDPQDTILLEDIKPVVMAELSKVLQLDDFDFSLSSQSNETDYFDQYPQDTSKNEQVDLYNSKSFRENYDYNYYDKSSDAYIGLEAQNNNQQESFQDTKPLFERRPRRKSFSYNVDDKASKTPGVKRSVDSRVTDYFPREEKFVPREQNQPVFDANAVVTEVEDTFAELDKQYHVAVDHDFIENDDVCLPDYNKIQLSDLAIKDEILYTNVESAESDALINLKNYVSPHNRNPDLNSDPSSCKLEDMGHQNTNKAQEIYVNQDQNVYENSHNKPAPKTPGFLNSRKRSIDQQPAHRKEKRKKIDDKDDHSHKSINKNDTVDSTLCSNKSNTPKPDIVSIKHDRSSIDERRKSTSEKGYLEKYVKRKESPKDKNIKNSDKRKRLSSTSSNHSVSPKNNDSITTPHTPSKTDSKSTLKTFDMFMEQPKKQNIHQAFRNTAQVHVIPKKNSDIKPKPISLLNQKSSKKQDVSTQVVKRVLTKETQTLTSKSSTSRFCQTDKKKFATKGTQANMQEQKSLVSNSTDAFERMKEIDIEIQVLLQEKFKLYNSLENKQKAVPMQTLGMAVLNIDSFDEIKQGHDTDIEDTIVNNFTNIPEEELEQIAFETVTENKSQPFEGNRRKRRQKYSIRRIESTSPQVLPKHSKKAKTPNISLIEQIITDDRPLEDIISLDDLEVTPEKSKQRTKLKPKKKTLPKKRKAVTPEFELKDCYVVLIREDLNKYFIPKTFDETQGNVIVMEENQINSETIQRNVSEMKSIEPIIEEHVENDLHFDMLDVSVDIVVGDNYELNCNDEKEAVAQIEVPISEEIILDNSQSSMEDVTTPAETQGGECILYDYSSDENLQRDSKVVSGNGDAILAIECIEQNFLAAGLDGNVYYFSGDGKLITTLRGSNLAVTCLTIVKEKYGTTVYTGSLDSRIRYYDLETGLEKGPECNVLSPIQTMDRAWDTVFVGTRTGFVLQFECKNNMLIPVSTVKFADQSILALRAMKEGPRKVLLVAARSDNVTVRDAQTGLLLRSLNGPKMTVYTLLYEDGKVYCGTSSNEIHVFDYSSGSHVGTHWGGKGAVCLLTSGGLVFSGCYDGCVYVYREGESRPMAQLRGPSPMLLSLAVMGSKIIAGYKDRSLYIWKIPLCILQEMIL